MRSGSSWPSVNFSQHRTTGWWRHDCFEYSACGGLKRVVGDVRRVDLISRKQQLGASDKTTHSIVSWHRWPTKIANRLQCHRYVVVGVLSHRENRTKSDREGNGTRKSTAQIVTTPIHGMRQYCVNDEDSRLATVDGIPYGNDPFREADSIPQRACCGVFPSPPQARLQWITQTATRST